MTSRLCAIMFACIGLFVAIPVTASDSPRAKTRVAILAENDNVTHREIVEHIQSRLLEQLPDVVLTVGASVKEISASGKPDLFVSIGSAKAQEVLTQATTTPVLCTVIPRAAYAAIEAELANSVTSNRAPHAVIYLDQPIQRRMRLIRLLLPQAKTVGIVLGTDSEKYAGEMRQAAAVVGLDTTIRVVADASDVIPGLNRVLDKSDAFLGVVDSIVFNRANARNILITAYQWRVPIFGISPPYVRAGALAAVYSETDQLALQITDTITRFRRAGERWDPVEQFPQHFHISVNRQVAESMGLYLESEAKLEDQLRKLEQAKP